LNYCLVLKGLKHYERKEMISLSTKISYVNWKW
jgi:hypothetical protein